MMQVYRGQGCFCVRSPGVLLLSEVTEEEATTGLILVLYVNTITLCQRYSR